MGKATIRYFAAGSMSSSYEYNRLMENPRPTPEGRLSEIARRVVNLATASLFVDMPFLDVALFRLRFDPDMRNVIPSWATDGREVHYDTNYVLGRYSEKASIVSHDILHVTLHCVFRHMFVHPEVNQRLWDLSCDIAVEHIISSLNMSSLDDGRAAMRDAYLGMLDNLPELMSAEKLYKTLGEAELSEEDFDVFEEAFGVDVHPWYIVENRSSGGMGPEREDDESDDGDAQNGPSSYGGQSEERTNDDAGSGSDDEAPHDEDSPEGEDASGEDQAHSREQLEREWEDASKSVQTGLETMHGRHGYASQAGTMLQALKAVNRRRYDYRNLLHAFCTWGEQIKINDEEFDYVYYTYGLDRYGDMPLIEPLEYKDVKKLRDVAIVIDTSGSVRGEAVQRLFERTFDLIMNENNAFKRFRIHLIQCDAQVSDDTVLTTRDDLDRALESMKFKGLGGTDFSPAFDYVDTLVAQGEFVNFKGLIYFTDGRGTYPEHCPAYKSAFVFIEDDYEDIDVPAWAIKIVLTEDEVRRL